MEAIISNDDTYQTRVRWYHIHWIIKIRITRLSVVISAGTVILQYGFTNLLVT